jgi:hypothetical protein
MQQCSNDMLTDDLEQRLLPALQLCSHNGLGMQQRGSAGMMLTNRDGGWAKTVW